MSRIVQVSKPVAADPGLFFTLNLGGFTKQDLTGGLLRIDTTITSAGDENEPHIARDFFHRPEDLSKDLVVMLPFNCHNYDSLSELEITIDLYQDKKGQWVRIGDNNPTYSGSISSLNKSYHLEYQPKGVTPPNQGSNEIQFTNVIASKEGGLGLTVDLSGVPTRNLTNHEIANEGIKVQVTLVDNNGGNLTQTSMFRRNKPLELNTPLSMILPVNIVSALENGVHAKISVYRNVLNSATQQLGSDEQPYLIPVTEITDLPLTEDLVKNNA